MVSKLSEKPRSASKDCKALNVAFLSENTFGDVQLRDEILGLFRAQLQTVDEALRQPMTEKGWKYMAHTLKGAAAAVGAQQITLLAAEWERAGLPSTKTDASVTLLTFADAVFEFEMACSEALGHG